MSVEDGHEVIPADPHEGFDRAEPSVGAPPPTGPLWKPQSGNARSKANSPRNARITGWLLALGRG